MNKKDFWGLQRSIGFEFSRYILAHPELSKKIPPNALVIFQIDDNPQFNKWALNMAKKIKEPKQPLIFIQVEKLLPDIESRLVNPRLKKVKTETVSWLKDA